TRSRRRPPTTTGTRSRAPRPVAGTRARTPPSPPREEPRSGAARKRFELSWELGRSEGRTGRTIALSGASHPRCLEIAKQPGELRRARAFAPEVPFEHLSRRRIRCTDVVDHLGVAL